MTPLAREIDGLVDDDALVSRLRDLVQEPSENPPGNEVEAARLVANYCKELGGEVEQHEAEPNRPSVVARWRRGPTPVVTYCSHIDVVPAGKRALWEFDPFGASVRDGRMHGRGTSDAKGPVAAAIEAVSLLSKADVELNGTLELALVADEEAMGFKGTGYLVEREILSPDVAIVGEPTSLRVVRAQRGACWIRIEAWGLAAHGSAPERGKSAIRHMAEIVRCLEETLPDVTHAVVGGPSINVGTIHGGDKVNMVPESCVVEVDRRSVPGEDKASVLESIEAAITKARETFPDIDARVEMPFYARPFEAKEDSNVVREVAAAVAEGTGSDAELAGFRGASDARFLAEAGADVVVCGPGEIALAHTVRESIDLAELRRAAVVYALAFARLLRPSS